jgi:transposase
MASIVRKIKKGRPYYYAVKPGRVQGKPRIVWQKYLGTVEAIVERTERAAPAKAKETVVFEAGAAAALLGIAQRLGVEELIDEAAPKRNQGPSVGRYMLLAALNRAIAPCSKAAIGQWYDSTVLRRLWRFPPSVFSSPRFWDHMDLVSEQAIDAIQERLAGRIRREFGMDGQVLLYDTTNFFTFLATGNDRCSLARRGRNKNKRHDLRQIGLALLTTDHYHIPLFHHSYEGNLTDVALFPQLARDLLNRHRQALGEPAQATLVFDKGNVSDEAMEGLVAQGLHFVAALPASRDVALLGTPLERFVELPGLAGTRAFATALPLWGAQCQAVVSYTESFFTEQLAAITRNLLKCQTQLHDREKALRRWREGRSRGRKPTVAGVKKSIAAVLSPQFMKDLFDVAVETERGLPRISYRVKHDALDELADHRLGRTLLVTSHRDWPARQVVQGYRSLAGIEEAFRHMKNPDFLHWQPAYHWTDQKLRVHAFYCVLALLLASLAWKVADEAGIDLSLPALLKDLCDIREVAIIYPQGPGAHPKDHLTLSRLSPRQKKLAACLRIHDLLKG